MEFRTIAGSVCIRDVPEFLNRIRSISYANVSVIQAMDADRIAGEKHIDFAVHKALRAIENNSNMARDTGIEIMRYASGKRQIEEAFSMGVREGQMNVVFVVLGDKDNVDSSVDELSVVIKDANVLEYSASKRADILEQFSITEKELIVSGEDMLPLLVLERVALVDLLK